MVFSVQLSILHLKGWLSIKLEFPEKSHGLAMVYPLMGPSTTVAPASGASASLSDESSDSEPSSASDLGRLDILSIPQMIG